MKITTLTLLYCLLFREAKLTSEINDETVKQNILTKNQNSNKEGSAIDKLSPKEPEKLPKPSSQQQIKNLYVTFPSFSQASVEFSSVVFDFSIFKINDTSKEPTSNTNKSIVKFIFIPSNSMTKEFKIGPISLPENFFIFSGNSKPTQNEMEEQLKETYFQFSVVKTEPGFNCFVKVQPSGISLDGNFEENLNNEKVELKAASKGILFCTEKSLGIKGNLVLHKRDFEFYKDLNFKISVIDLANSKELFWEVIYVNTNEEEESSEKLKNNQISNSIKNSNRENMIQNENNLKLNPEDEVVPFELGEKVAYGTKIQINLICLTSDYYTCSIDKGEGKLYGNLEVVIRCEPRSKKYDKLYYFAMVMAGFMLVSFAVCVGYDFYIRRQRKLSKNK